MVKRYAIQHRRSCNSIDDGVIIATGFLTLEAARAERYVSGDLVVDSDTLEVVKDPAWLFPWESKDPNCYAQRAIACSPIGLPDTYRAMDCETYAADQMARHFNPKHRWYL